MKTILSMNIPEAIQISPIEINAAAELSDSEYRELWTDGVLPERLIERLNRYTGLVLERPGSGMIAGYSAMLVYPPSGSHAVAVCGRNGIDYAGVFPQGREWLDRQIGQMADYICGLSRVPGAKLPNRLSMDSITKIFDSAVTADNGVGELLLAELKARGEIADIILREDCFEIHYAPDISGESAPVIRQAESGFIEAMRKIQGIDESKTPEWLGHARTLAARFADDSGIPEQEVYPAVLKEFAAAFANVDRHFESCACEIYNYRAAYVPRQLMNVANYLCEGGGAEDAYQLAREGYDFSRLTTPADEDQGMDMQ